MATYMQGALKSGSAPSDDGNAGYAVFAKAVLVDYIAETGGGSDNVDVPIVIPAGSQIHSIHVDTLTAWNSVTSATLSIGTSAGGQEFFDNTDVKTTGRETTVPTAADLALWGDVASNNTLYVRVAQVGNTSAGQARVTVLYSPKA